MPISLPAKLRAALYILTGLGTPVVTYLLSKGIIGSDEVVLWGAEVTVISAIAAFKAISPDEQTPAEESELGHGEDLSDA